MMSGESIFSNVVPICMRTGTGTAYMAPPVVAQHQASETMGLAGANRAINFIIDVNLIPNPGRMGRIVSSR